MGDPGAADGPERTVSADEEAAAAVKIQARYRGQAARRSLAERDEDEPVPASALVKAAGAASGEDEPIVPSAFVQAEKRRSQSQSADPDDEPMAPSAFVSAERRRSQGSCVKQPTTAPPGEDPNAWAQQVAKQRPARSDGKYYAKRPQWEKITCPYLCMLYMNGDLDVGDDGTMTRDQLRVALARGGLQSPVMLDGLTIGAKDKPLNIFKMDGNMVVEHSFSTGIRDPLPNAAKFDELAAFATDGKMYEGDFGRALPHFQKNPNDTNPNAQLKGGVDLFAVHAGLLTAFGYDDEARRRYLPVDALRAMYLEGKYPPEWTVRPWGLGKVGSIYCGMSCGCVDKLKSCTVM